MSAKKLVIIAIIAFVSIGAWAIFAVDQVEKLGHSEKVKGKQTQR